jgi:AraC-like DNA-binding protein
MLRAADQLVHSSDSVLAIAQSPGYASESAFGLAFKKVMGCSPRQYGRDRSLDAGARDSLQAQPALPLKRGTRPDTRT